MVKDQARIDGLLGYLIKTKIDGLLGYLIKTKYKKLKIQPEGVHIMEA
jgi:hypothetical protein